MTAWAFSVVSSALQADTLPAQRAWAKEVAAKNGWTIERTFSAVSSGKSGVRKLMQTLIDELRATPKVRRPKRVLMVRLDRAGRGNAIDAIAAIAEIRQLGVMIHTRVDGDVRLDRVADTLKPIFDLIQGGLENEARSDRSRAGQARRRHEGKHAGHAPYGVKLKDGKPVPDAPRSRIVRKAFEMRATGAGYERIAHCIGPLAPPKPLRNGSFRKIGWHRTFVRTMLSCRTYRGVVVPEELWDRVQFIKNPDFKERAVMRFPWPLTGVVKCWCGYALTGKASGGNCDRCKGGRRKHNHQRIRYYSCNNPIAHLEMQERSRPHIRADRLEHEFVALLKELTAKPALIEQYRRAPAALSETSAIRSNLHDLERDLAEIDQRRKAAWDIQAAGAIGADELAKRLAELAGERALIQGQVTANGAALSVATAEATVTRDAKRVLSRAAATWLRCDAPTQKDIARLVSQAVGALSVAPDKHLKIGRDGVSRKNREQFSTLAPSQAIAGLEALLELA